DTSPSLGLLTLPLIPSPPLSPSPSPPSSPVLAPRPRPVRQDLPPVKRARVARYHNYVPEEETIRNDYPQRYVDSGERPQNWALGADPEHRFEEYPKQQRLLSLKKASVARYALPPTYLPFSHLATLHPSKFDVILIDPAVSSSFTWDHLQELPPILAADPSYMLMWVCSGAGDGLERGREVMAKWGFRRCEDIVWVKTNHISNHGPGWFVHCNVDTDVMIGEGDTSDPMLKPPETYTLIENFCLGMRRLELFGCARTLRRGWVTALAEGEEERIKEGLAALMWNRESWEAGIKELSNGGKAVVPMTPEIDALRPKSPVRGGSTNLNAGMGSGAGPAQTGAPGALAMPMNPPPNRSGGFQDQNRMMMPQPIMPMNALGVGEIGNMGNVGMMGWDGMMGMQGMHGMGGMGMGMGVPQGMGFSGFDGGMGMGWEEQFGGGRGMWDEGMM
ncbi:uncharacterized protein LAESUDRAFT_765567, partial [Laetiporus sulphureus 93-53]